MLARAELAAFNSELPARRPPSWVLKGEEMKGRDKNYPEVSLEMGE